MRAHALLVETIPCYDGSATTRLTGISSYRALQPDIIHPPNAAVTAKELSSNREFTNSAFGFG